MKKILLSCAALITVCAVNAQSQPKISAEGGAAFSTIKGDAAGSLGNVLSYTKGAVSIAGNTSFYGGLRFYVPVDDVISVQPGVFYSQKGYTLNGELNLKGLEFAGINARAKLISNFVDIPLIMNASVGSGFNVFLGPQVSYLANAKLNTTAGLLGIDLLNKTMDVTNQFNRWDVALTGGLGFQVTKNIGIKGSYDYGLSRVDKNKSLKTGVRTIKVGLSIGF